MKHYIEDRTLRIAKFIAENKATVRGAAKKFGVSKSTVHKDITQRLKQISPILYRMVTVVLKENKEERHIRGGLATKLKYENKRKDIN